MSKLVIFLIVIAVLSLLFLFLTLFTPLVDTEVKTSTTNPIKLGTPEFYSTIESITRTQFHPLSSEVEVLDTGDKFMEDFLSEAKSAKQSITVANYIWSKGQLTDDLFDTLISKAKEGVEVRVILDGFGKLHAPDDKIQELKEAGGKVEIFRPLSLRTFTRIFKRSHLRAMVVDGRVGYTGGMAFTDEWLGDGVGEYEWRDNMFKLTGSEASSIQDMFSALWRETSGEILSGEKFYPAYQQESAVTLPMYLTYLHTPFPDLNKSLSNLLWLSFSGAENHIYIETPYLMPDKNLLAALKDKARSGVDVEIVVPGKYIDSKTVQAASRSYYKELLDAGVKIYEYQVGLFHAKTLTIDGEWSVVGSANLDNRSSTLNVEGLLAVTDTKLATQLESEFALDKSRSKLIDDQSFSQNWALRILGRLSRLFVKQY